MTDWVKCSERMPSKGGEYLVWIEYETRTKRIAETDVARYCPCERYSWKSQGHGETNAVLAWAEFEPYVPT